MSVLSSFEGFGICYSIGVLTVPPAKNRRVTFLFLRSFLPLQDILYQKIICFIVNTHTISKQAGDRLHRKLHPLTNLLYLF